MSYLNRFLKMFGLTMFELYTTIILTTLFCCFLALKLCAGVDLSWTFVFLPLFVSDAMVSYFCVIVFIRQQLTGRLKRALMRASWGLTQVALLSSFKVLLCLKLEDKDITLSEILLPLSIYCTIFVVRVCNF